MVLSGISLNGNVMTIATHILLALSQVLVGAELNREPATSVPDEDAKASLSIELHLDEAWFGPYEEPKLLVVISNTSGQTLELPAILEFGGHGPAFFEREYQGSSSNGTNGSFVRVERSSRRQLVGRSLGVAPTLAPGEFTLTELDLHSLGSFELGTKCRIRVHLKYEIDFGPGSSNSGVVKFVDGHEAGSHSSALSAVSPVIEFGFERVTNLADVAAIEALSGKPYNHAEFASTFEHDRKFPRGVMRRAVHRGASSFATDFKSSKVSRYARELELSYQVISSTKSSTPDFEAANLEAVLASARLDSREDDFLHLVLLRWSMRSSAQAVELCNAARDLLSNNHEGSSGWLKAKAGGLLSVSTSKD